jgi:hypothetical protein
VANAIGAVVGQVSQSVSGIVTSPTEGRYTAHLVAGIEHFSTPEAALAALGAALKGEAVARAAAAGAEAAQVSLSEVRKEAKIEGRPMFIEARLTATATGRPRVARG